MKKFLAVMLALSIVFAFASNSIAAKKTGTGKKSLEETAQVIGKIVQIDVVASKISIKGQNGQIKEYHVPSQLSTYLSQYKVGNMVTATGEIDATTESLELKSLVKRR